MSNNFHVGVHTGGNGHIGRCRPRTAQERAAAVELSELVSALTLFVENYRLMHAGTRYASEVEPAARQVRAKLRELISEDVVGGTGDGGHVTRGERGRGRPTVEWG